MAKQIKKLVIKVLVLTIIIGVFLELTSYRRKILPMGIKNIQAETFDDYIYELVLLLFPDYEIHKREGLEQPGCLPNQSKCIEVIVNSPIGPDVYFRLNESTTLMILLSYYPSLDIDGSQVPKKSRDTIVLQECGDKADGKECAVYTERLIHKCYTNALNHQFSANGSFAPYCPTKLYFKNEREQIANYFFDGFMRLDIPYELSREYIRSQQ